MAGISSITLVMNAFRAGEITRAEVKHRIADWKAYSKLSTGSDYVNRWGQAATQLEYAIQRHPSPDDKGAPAIKGVIEF